MIPAWPTLEDFLHWFLRQPMRGWHSSALYDYGPVRSLVVYRHGSYQVELFTIVANAGFPEEHRHPDVESYEVHMCGQIQLTLNGVLSCPTRLRLPHGRRQYVTHIRETDWHGAAPLPTGGAFVSVQRWLHDVPPTSVGLNWEGKPVSVQQQELLASSTSAVGAGGLGDGTR